ncbi:hypothetical protein Q8F55_002158 [Vanrija albida]|uniref:XPG-I domain-containing protein n=1 Tax=Vanrija albida TaxID=181172 RepID=A0ABR3Q988_9TREE
MGVPGLWDLIRPAAVRTSLSALAREAFLSNSNGQRAFVIGIDASLWIFHAQSTQAGSNPFLRTLFYKIAALLQHPLLPLFVFDGPNKPQFKRGQKVTGQFGRNDFQSRQFKQLLDACGLEWWNAPGEAEAELALMNRQGKIDAVLSDDVDTLLFGAKCLIRNNSPTLSGTRSNATQVDQRHYEMFTASDILKHLDADGSALSTEEDLRRAMVLIALLGGGDYVPEGVFQFGPKISLGLAHAGCADFLRHYEKDRNISAARLDSAKRRIEEELRTNSGGYVGRRYKTRAEALQATSGSTVFPATSLESYLNPVTSGVDPQKGWPGFGIGPASQTRGLARNTGRGDIEGMARACETYFEWGTVDAVCKKFAGEAVNLFGADIVTAARQRLLAVDKISTPSRPARSRAPPTPPDDASSPHRITSFFRTSLPSSRRMPRVDSSKPSHLCKIHSSRKEPTSDDITEYRLSFRTDYFAQRCRSAMDGTRLDPSQLTATQRSSMGLVEEGRSAADAAPLKEETRMWVPDYLLQSAWPVIVSSYDEELAAKEAAKSAPKGRGRTKKAPPAKPRQEDSDAFVAFFKSPPKARGSSRSRRQDGSDSLPSPESVGRELSEVPSQSEPRLARRVSPPQRLGARSQAAASTSPILFIDDRTPERETSRRRSATAQSNQTGSAVDPITIDFSSGEELTPVNSSQGCGCGHAFISRCFSGLVDRSYWTSRSVQRVCALARRLPRFARHAISNSSWAIRTSHLGHKSRRCYPTWRSTIRKVIQWDRYGITGDCITARLCSCVGTGRYCHPARPSPQANFALHVHGHHRFADQLTRFITGIESQPLYRGQHLGPFRDELPRLANVGLCCKLARLTDVDLSGALFNRPTFSSNCSGSSGIDSG